MEASAKPVPLDEYMAEDLLRWRRISPYALASDWVFTSPHARGRQPYWPDDLMKRHIRPAARKAGVNWAYCAQISMSLGCQSSLKLFGMMAGTTGLEPATSAVTGQRSNQLSYVPRLIHPGQRQERVYQKIKRCNYGETRSILPTRKM